jgi:hypothetical protein
MATHQQFQVEPVQLFQSGHGFTIANQHHRPLFSIVYHTAPKPTSPRDAITAVLANAIEVTNYG